MTRKEYWWKIHAISERLVSECHRPENGEDGPKWLDEKITHYSENFDDVLRFTNNKEAYYDDMGEWPRSASFDGMLKDVAFYAMRQDVMDFIDNFQTD